MQKRGVQCRPVPVSSIEEQPPNTLSFQSIVFCTLNLSTCLHCVIHKNTAPKNRARCIRKMEDSECWAVSHKVVIGCINTIFQENQYSFKGQWNTKREVLAQDFQFVCFFVYFVYFIFSVFLISSLPML